MNSKSVVVLCALVTAVTATGCGREKVESVEAMNSCVEYHRRQLYQQAIRDCSKAVSLNPDNEKAQHNLALVYISTKEYEQATRHLSKAVALNSGVALYHYQLGEVYEWAGQPEQAASSLEKAIELDGTLFKAHYRLGNVYASMDDPQKAMQKYSDALSGNPRFFDAYRDLASLYADYGFPSQALQVLDEGIKALDGQPDNLAVLYHLRGTVLADQKEYDKAVVEFRKAIEINPHMEDAMFSLGWSYSYVNKENAKIWLQKFVTAASQNTRPDYLAAANARLAEIENGTPF
ncbi:MAG: tetratricopeptide repeat protein [Myxococcota bacterium]|jgi:tetratricopeptide (TPR) repeat protein|nr:tetratricopeptide repeat protein [Myxococcota bacterium]